MRDRDSLGLVGSFITAAAAMVLQSTATVPPDRDRRFWNRRTGYRPHQGYREIARRRRQIERGQLRADNGLVREGE